MGRFSDALLAHCLTAKPVGDDDFSMHIHFLNKLAVEPNGEDDFSMHIFICLNKPAIEPDGEDDFSGGPVMRPNCIDVLDTLLFNVGHL